MRRTDMPRIATVLSAACVIIMSIGAVHARVSRLHSRCRVPSAPLRLEVSWPPWWLKLHSWPTPWPGTPEINNEFHGLHKDDQYAYETFFYGMLDGVYLEVS
jgi:hypothetical protein